MGNTIHVQIKHEIEYGAEGFNWEIDELKSLLEDNGCSVYGELDEDCRGDWKVQDSEFEDAVKRIEETPAETVRQYFSGDFTGKRSAEEIKSIVVSLLKQFVQTGDHRRGYYHLTWF